MTTPAFQQFKDNISYARNLITGGRALEALRNASGAVQFGDLSAADPMDLYRAAWSQSIAALDHWLHEEVLERAVALTDDSSNQRPPKLNSLKMPWDMVERTHQEPIRDVFREFLEGELRFRSYHNTESIAQGIQLVVHLTPNQIWGQVAQILGLPSAQVKHRHDQEIVKRRNDIAHRADHSSAGVRQTMAGDDAQEAVEWVYRLAQAITAVLS